MAFVSLVEPISKRIDIARRISNAEIKFQKIRPKNSRGAGSSCDKKPNPTRENDDEKVAKVLQECIGLRLEKLRISYFGPHQRHSVSDWWGVSWLFALWSGEPGVSIRRHERRIANIELMLNLVENRDSFGPEFWTKIAQWQLLKFQRDARKLLDDFDKLLNDTGRGGPVANAYRSAIAGVDERAQAEAPPTDVTWADVFITRHPSADPSIKAFINLELNPSRGGPNLMALIDELLLEAPLFPPDCHALEF